MAARDVRAVENPITAIFDLAEDVERQAPKTQRLLKYTRIFLYVFLVLDVLLIVLLSGPGRLLALLLTLALWGILLVQSAAADVTAKGLALAGSLAVAVLLILAFGVGLLFGVILVSLFYLGMVILDLVRDARGFVDYYARRYRVVRAVREADPVVLVPQGATPVERLLTHLAQRSPAVATMLASRQNVRAPAILTGRSGVAYQLDAFLSWPADTLAPFGMGHEGSAVYVKAFDRAPTGADLEALRRAVVDITQAVRVPPGRVVALWKSDGTADVPEDAYAFLTTQVVQGSMRGHVYACSIELVTEMPDGTYDFIPFVVDPALTGAVAGASRPQPSG